MGGSAVSAGLMRSLAKIYASTRSFAKQRRAERFFCTLSHKLIRCEVLLPLTQLRCHIRAVQISEKFENCIFRFLTILMIEKKLQKILIHLDEGLKSDD